MIHLQREPPKFTKTISNFTATAGVAEIKLTCQARASKKTQYWWKKDGQNIDTTTKRLKYKHFRYLKIKKVKFSDAGKYTCIAKNEAGEIQHTMRLYVTAPKPTSHLPEGKPFFTRLDKMDKEVLVFPAANAVNMVCDANGNPAPTVTWYKDGKMFTKRKDETYHTITPHTFTLSIKSVIPADSGIYKCNVSNKYGYINKTYKLEVQEKPKKIDVSIKLSVINVKESAIPAVELRVAEGTTAFSILQLASQQSPCYKFEHQYYPDLGRFITSICCMEQNQIAKLYWMIYINGQLATVGADNLKPKNGDRVTFKYETVDQTAVRNHRDESEL